jgi:hypothetical protein
MLVHADGHARVARRSADRGELPGALLLHPAVECHPRRQVPAGRRHGRPGDVPQLRRPVRPSPAVALGQGAVGGPVAQRLVVGLQDVVERVGAALEPPECLQRRTFGRPHQVVIDPFGVRCDPQGVDLGADGGVGPTVGRQVLDAKGQRVGEAPAGRGIGGGLHRMGRPRGMQGVEQHRAGPMLGSSPLDELTQVPEVPDTPGAG